MSARFVWPHSLHGAWHLYGHSHGNLKDDPAILSIDVGVETHHFMPWHFDEVKAVMEAKKCALSELCESSKKGQQYT